MARAGLLAFLAIPCACAALALSSTAVTAGCDTANTFSSPDGAPPPCSQGPFPFPGALPSSDTTTLGCSSDDNANLPVIALLPHGQRYPVGDTVNYVGTRDLQGDCELQTVCHCVVPNETDIPSPSDAGLDTDAETTTGDTTPGAPAWQCQ